MAWHVVPDSSPRSIDDDDTPTSGGGAADPGDASTVSARILGLAVGAADPGELDSLHVELALAVGELSAAAGRAWCWGPDDPVVALVRAVARLMADHPDAPTRHGARLVATLGTGHR